MDSVTERLKLTLSGFKCPELSEEITINGKNRRWKDPELNAEHIPVRYTIADVLGNDFFLEQAQKIRSQAILVPDRALYQATGIKGKLKQVCAKLFRWYILPMAEDQNTYNVATYQMLVYMNKQIEMSQQEIGELKEQLEILRGIE